MKILIIRNESKDLPPYDIPLHNGRITTDTYKKATNLLMQGVTVTLRGKPIPTQRKPLPRFRYQPVELTDPSQLPVEVRKAAKLHGLRQAVQAHNDKIKARIENYIGIRQRVTLNLDVRNDYYEDIMRVALDLNIVAYSPCLKTLYEARAKNLFHTQTTPTKQDATDYEIELTKFYAPRFGLQLPTLRYYYASRKAVKFATNPDGSLKYGEHGPEILYSHGFTQEIEYLPNGLYRPSVQSDGKSERNYEALFHPNTIPEEWQTQETDATKAQWKETYEQVKFFLDLPLPEQNEFIALGYERCPHCGNIARKIDNGTAVECEFCAGVLEDFSYTTNDHLLYGTDTDAVYSSFEDLQNYLLDKEYAVDETLKEIV